MDVTFIGIVVGPLVKILRIVDRVDKAKIDYLYESMDRAKKTWTMTIKKWWNGDKHSNIQHKYIHACCRWHSILL